MFDDHDGGSRVHEECVVQGILYERIVHMLITYIALDCLFERSGSLLREVYDPLLSPIIVTCIYEVACWYVPPLEIVLTVFVMVN